MSGLFRFPDARRRHPDVEVWFRDEPEDLGAIALHWFTMMRQCGDDVREVLHDGHPTACVEDAAFAYVDAFSAHVNVGFYRGAMLDDPAGLLQGTGKMMRHVKLRPGSPLDAPALATLIAAGYADMTRATRVR